MFLTPCRLATESSILRATSVSSWAGAAPSRVAVTVTMGSSMSGKSCTLLALKASRPARLSRMNSMIAGTGFLIDRAEKFMAGLWCASGLLGRDRSLGGRRGDVANQVAVIEETGAVHHQQILRADAGHHFDAVGQAAARVDFQLAHALVGIEAEHITETVAHHHRLLRHRHRRRAAQVELPAGEHARFKGRVRCQGG